MADLENMTDEQLANWQGGWQANTPKYILAEKEWERRMISHEFSLQKQLAAANQRWSIIAAIIGVVGTLAGAVLGGYLSQKDNSPPLLQQMRSTPSQSPTQKNTEASSAAASSKQKSSKAP